MKPVMFTPTRTFDQLPRPYAAASQRSLEFTLYRYRQQRGNCSRAGNSFANALRSALFMKRSHEPRMKWTLQEKKQPSAQLWGWFAYPTG
jgi:hypothetical protein